MLPPQEFLYNDSGREYPFDALMEDSEAIRSRSLAVLVLVFLANILGNSLLSCSLFKQCKQPLTDMTPVQYLILQAAFADLAFGLLSILPEVVAQVTAPAFKGNSFLCKAVKYLQLIPMFSSSYFVVVLSIDRYIAICRPLASIRFKYSRVRFMTIVTWIISGLFSIPQLFIFELNPGYGSRVHIINGTDGNQTVVVEREVDFYMCSTDNKSHNLNIYVLWFSIMAWILPSLTIAVFYTLVLRSVWNSWSYGQVSYRYNPDGTTSSCSTRTVTDSSIKRKKGNSVKRKKGNKGPDMSHLSIGPAGPGCQSIDKALSSSRLDNSTNINSTEVSPNNSRENLSKNPSPSKYRHKLSKDLATNNNCGSYLSVNGPYALETSFGSPSRRRAKSDIPDAAEFLSRHTGGPTVGTVELDSHRWRCNLNQQMRAPSPLTDSRGRPLRRISSAGSVNLQKTTSPGVTKRKLHTVKLILTIIICHFLLWSPFCLTSLLLCFCKSCVDDSTATYILLSGNLNSCVNPWIYFTFHWDKLYSLLIGADKKSRRRCDPAITSARNLTVQKGLSNRKRTRAQSVIQK